MKIMEYVASIVLDIIIHVPKITFMTTQSALPGLSGACHAVSHKIQAQKEIYVKDMLTGAVHFAKVKRKIKRKVLNAVEYILFHS